MTTQFKNLPPLFIISQFRRNAFLKFFGFIDLALLISSSFVLSFATSKLRVLYYIF